MPPQTCPFAVRGCRQKVEEVKLEEHKNACRFRTRQCTHCKAQVDHNNLPEHEQNCEKRPLPCTQGCPAKRARAQMEEHIKKECGKTEKDCLFPQCPKRVKRDELEKHYKEIKKEHRHIFRRRVNTTQEETLSIPNFTTAIVGMGQDESIDTPHFSIQGQSFCFELFPFGETQSLPGRAAACLRKLDDYKGIIELDMKVVSSTDRITMSLMKDWSEIAVGGAWGYPNLCPLHQLLKAASEFNGELTIELKVTASMDRPSGPVPPDTA
uniref:TRAF-type domain-containing protein n=1 Tax=Chromera velia CCMP2878 TaxID=1169474 RepID=A0A0G4HKC9_9ALVE|eukprot:Cvel_7240.t1-p1 / transcript=Cvel_7240.t1 / gene=Cvel_7240 / organism=Chromera_velia_CCMP2878 / gene_product=TNF receptor-associated factor family protein, putative / transcript_product=TNF receptor-associated factor family protein, putative / location=Cvel_scaffold373:69919-71141(-) / protein_length=266 / sequence_SO=supercontig / SO=protein_coding / is_pseudo=false